MRAVIVLPERLRQLAHASGFNGANEHGAWLILSKNMGCDGSARLIVREVIPLGTEDVASAGPDFLRIKTPGFVRLMKRAAAEDTVLGFLHGHPGGYSQFSAADDANESNLWLAVRKRMPNAQALGSVLALPDGTFRGRIWSGSGHPRPVPVRINGALSAVHGAQLLCPDAEADLNRQTPLFGRAFNQQLAALTVVVIGAGGTGSPLCVMLARSGARRVIVIDPDHIERSNVHRSHIATMADVGQPKAVLAKREIERLGLGVECEALVHAVSDPECRSALKSADVVMCATDDHSGRAFLNRFAYCYETLVLDMGLAADINAAGDVVDVTGRVTRLHPGAPCLLCRRVINLRRAREEHLQRADQHAYTVQQAEGYVISQGDPEPAFISMTTSVATMALEELAQCYSQFRGAQFSPAQRLRRFIQIEDRRSGGQPDPECPICGTGELWGRGDMTPFLDQVN